MNVFVFAYYSKANRVTILTEKDISRLNGRNITEFCGYVEDNKRTRIDSAAVDATGKSVYATYDHSIVLFADIFGHHTKGDQWMLDGQIR